MKPQVIRCPDDSLEIVPLTGEEAAALTAAMGISGPNDPDQPVFNGRFTLMVPAARAKAAEQALPKLAALVADRRAAQQVE